jgi:hypothetical protein
MSEIDGNISDDRASALWLHLTKLYSRKGNSSEGTNYGWATLRASALHALALQGIRESSEDAAVSLLALMGEISPERKGGDSFLGKLESLEADDYDGAAQNFEDSQRSDGYTDANYADATNSYIGAESVVSAARSYVRTQVKDVRTQVKDARARGVNYISSSGNNITSSLLVAIQSKWVEDNPIPSILFPLADASDISHSIISMKCVWSSVRFDNCEIAQQKLIGQISGLRKDLPASSLSGTLREHHVSSSPIRIASAMILKSESHAELERVKVKTDNEENQGAMATFYNPYANKKKKGEVNVTLVAEGEERYVLIEFVNTLSVPLEIPRCQLEFNHESDRIKAPAMSFVIPGQSSNFEVQFPFIILPASQPQPVDVAAVADDTSEQKNANAFEVKGLHVTFMGRSFFLPIEGSPGETTEPNIPKPVAVYPRRNFEGNKTEAGQGAKAPRLEIVPPQPHLLVSFATSPTPIDEYTVVPVPLCDGEIFTLPLFRLKNDAGPNSLGKIEQLLITAHGLPGQSLITLFDLNSKSGNTESEEKATKRSEGARPFKLTAVCEEIDGESLNMSSDGTGGSIVSLQIAAAHDMGAHTKGCSIQIRFRYRGSSPSSEFEIWRKREVQIRLVRTKGPRISSLTFRPDLSWKSAYSELCTSLARQNSRDNFAIMPTEKDLPQSGSTDDKEFVMNRLGMDRGVHVCGDKVVALISVANETNAAIVLSSSNGLVGGFENSPVETLQVLPGVSAKVPMVISRVGRAPDICAQLIVKTSLNWESEVEDNSASAGEKMQTGGTMVAVNRRIRRGVIQIPSGCLKTIVDENLTFLSRICKSPCKVQVGISGQDGVKCVQVAPGKPLDTIMQMEFAEWVPANVRNNSSFTVEFCCARKEKVASGTSDGRREFAWCGQVRKSLLSGGEESKSHSHTARIVFLHEGHYVVSACVNIKNDESSDGVNEIWWAEEAQHIHVKETTLSQ